MGVVFIAGGLLALAIGVEGLRAVLDWGSAQGSGFMRVWAGLALAAGSALVYALLPKSRAD